MNRNMRSSIDQGAPPQAGAATIPSLQTIRAQATPAQSSLALLHPPLPSSRRPTSGEIDFSSPSNYPSPSPGFEQDISRPESSAQGASRHGANVQDHLSSQSIHHASHYIPSPLAFAAPQRTIEQTSDTFGRASGNSVISEPRVPTATRRNISPTEHNAFGQLASDRMQPGARVQNDEITQYLSHDGHGGRRQQKIHALEKELNLSNPSSPATGTSNLTDEDAKSPVATHASLFPPPPLGRQRPEAAALQGGGIGDTPRRTSRDQPQDWSQTNTRSHDGSRPSRSETTSSGDTDHSHRATYGVGEAGSDQHFSALARTLTSDQRRQQEELGRMSQQRVLASSGSVSTGLASPLTLASPATYPQRALDQSNRTTIGTSAAQAPASTQRQDESFNWQTQARTFSEAARSPVSSQGHGYDSAFQHRQLFHGQGPVSSSKDSMDRLSDPVSPQLPEGPADNMLTRSASVRVKTPMFGNTLAELPANHRASQKGALHEQGAAPYPSPGSVHGGSANAHSETEPVFDQVHPVPHASTQGHPSQSEQTGLTSQSHADEQRRWWRARNSQPQEMNDYHGQPAQAEGPETAVDHGYHPVALDDVNKTPQLPNLGDVYAVAPKFPAAPYSQYRGLHLPSRLARVHHTVLPLLTYAHIPITLFLDFNVVFALAQIALHPDNVQSGTRAAWWIALGIYNACILIWLLGVVVVYEGFWSFARRWTVSQPLVMPIYLSSPAFVHTASKDYSLYSLLYRARAGANRRDALIESFWFYSQNWPTMLTLVPRGAISVIVLVIYRPFGSALTTQGARDAAYFNQTTQRLSQFAFILIIVQAAWAACKLGVLLVANIGLAATLGFMSLIQQEQDWNAFATNQMTGFTGYGRSGIEAQHVGPLASKRGAWSQDDDVINEASRRRWAWRWRAEDRIRAILFDQGLLHHASSSQIWQQDHKQVHISNEEDPAQHALQSSHGHPAMYDGKARDQAYRHSDPSQEWAGSEMPISQSQTGLAITAPEAIQPEMWASMHPVTSSHSRFVSAAPTSQPLSAQGLATPPSDDGGHSNASDPYSPAPLPIGRSPRSKEQLRGASSISSRNDHALLAPHSGPLLDSPQDVEAGLPALLVPQRADGQTQTASMRSDKALGSEPHETGIRSQGPLGSSFGASPTPSAVAPLQLSSEGAPLSGWRGRKRPRDSPMSNYLPTPDPGGMVSETEGWLQHQIEEGADENNEQDERPQANPSFDKPMSYDNDRRIMQAFVPMPASFAMIKDASATGSPDLGGSDTKHSSWPAPAPMPELFAVKPAVSATTSALHFEASVPNSSTTSLGSLLRGHRTGTSPSGHGLDTSSEDGINKEGGERSKKQGLNSFIGRISDYSPSETSKRSGSGGRPEGAPWTSKFGSGNAASPAKIAGSSGSRTAMQLSEFIPEVEPELQGEDVIPTVITTSASTSLPYLDSGSVLLHDNAGEETGEPLQVVPRSNATGPRLLAPDGSSQHGARRSGSPAGSLGSNSSAGTDDSEEGRLWASFPDQSRRHPPGLIALNIEQRSLAEQRLAAAASEQNAAIQQQRLLYGNPGTYSASTSVPGPAMNLSPLMHPNVLAAIGNAASTGLPVVLGGNMQLPISPSEGGLHAIREESWTSSLDSRSQGATGSTRSRGTASAVTASPIEANFPMEQLEEVAVPHRPSNSSLGRRFAPH